MKTVYIFLAEGFEEIEAVTPIDVLRRAGVAAVSVGVSGKTVTGAHGISVVADLDGEGFALPQDAGMVILPGGGLGTQNLAASEMVAGVLAEAAKRNIYVAAICAAPTVLDKAGLLKSKHVTAFPDVQKELTDSVMDGGPAVVDGKIVTGRSAGVALQFAHELAILLVGQQKADEVVANLYPEK